MVNTSDPAAFLDRGMLAALQEPFPAAAIQWLPRNITKARDRALGVPFVDSRYYQGRLDKVAGPNWSDHYDILEGGAQVLCSLTIGGVTREDVGEKTAADQNTLTSAKAQAFKRACSAFGLGRFLYAMPKTWAPYDDRRKTFTPEGKAQLAKVSADFVATWAAALESGREPAPANGGDESPDPVPPPEAPGPEKAQAPTPEDDPPATSPKALLEIASRRGQVPPDNIHHLLNRIRKVMEDPKWSWPAHDDKAGWWTAYTAAMVADERAASGEEEDDPK